MQFEEGISTGVPEVDLDDIIRELATGYLSCWTDYQNFEGSAWFGWSLGWCLWMLLLVLVSKLVSD